MPVVLAFERLVREGWHEFVASVVYIVSSRLTWTT